MKVIFHADDFGLTDGINEGIIRSFKNGLLSSASLVSGGETAEEALSLARENPDLDVGLHLILCDESPVLPTGRFESIISKTGSFASLGKIFQAILTRRINCRQVEEEWRAQIEKALDAGVPISHLDSHQYVHLFPGLWPLCLRLAVQYQIPFVRTSVLDPLFLDASLKRQIQLFILKLWTGCFISFRRFLPVRSIPSIGFIHAGGRMRRRSLLDMIDRLRCWQRHPVVEVMVHPGTNDPHTANKYKHWGYKWENDLQLLLDPFLADALDRRGIEITSFRKLIERRI